MNTKAELVALLRRVEKALTDDPRHDAWDLGPSTLLREVRETLRRHDKQAARRKPPKV